MGPRATGATPSRDRAGSTTCKFNGANIDENFDVSANGTRVRFTRDVGTVTMDLNGVENIDLLTLGRGRQRQRRRPDRDRPDLDRRRPARANGGGDGAADTVTVNGTGGNDTFGAAGDAGGVTVSGLHTPVKIFFAEAANDLLDAQRPGRGRTRSNAIAAGRRRSGWRSTAGPGPTSIIGGDGNDLIIGGTGNDAACCGAGDDTFVWNPGDGSDTSRARPGPTRMLFNGANIDEKIDISANGTPGPVHPRRGQHRHGPERDRGDHLQRPGRGRPDHRPRPVRDRRDRGQPEPGGDRRRPGTGRPTRSSSRAPPGDDVATVAGDASGTSVNGLAARVNITGAEAANDRLTVNAWDGDDVVEASGLAATAIRFAADGGDGRRRR